MLLSNKPCTDPAILEHINPKHHGDFNAGEVGVPGKPPLALCYDRVDMGPGVDIIGASGIPLTVPLSQFQRRTRI